MATTPSPTLLELGGPPDFHRDCTVNLPFCLLIVVLNLILAFNKAHDT